jgi:enamine deaminase RidA (YjgF/YER057c/UK114 family)
VTVTYKNPTTLPPPIGLYSHVARAGNLVFFAGMVAVDKEGKAIGKGNLEAQMKALFAVMGEALKSEGLSFSNIVQMTTYLVRVEDIAEFYRVRVPLFKELYPDGKVPPNTLLIISRLVNPDLLIEIQFAAAA